MKKPAKKIQTKATFNKHVAKLRKAAEPEVICQNLEARYGRRYALKVWFKVEGK